MNNWVKIRDEEMSYMFDIANLKKGELQLKYAQDMQNKDKEIERLNNIINECANDILKELKENNHLSYGVALAIRQKLLNYKELKGVDKEWKK